MLFYVAIFATFCAFGFGLVSAIMANSRENKKDIIKSATSFCDELMDDACKYWVSECCDENKIEMGVLRWRISSYITLINMFLQENFPDNSDIEQALEQVNENIGGSNFDLSKREPDTKKAALSTVSIIQLRLIVSKQKVWWIW